MVFDILIDGPDDGKNRYHHHDQSDDRDELQGSYRERGNTIERQADHLRERIFRGACLALLTVVIHEALLKADLPDHSTKEKVTLRILQECFYGPLAHQPVVGMIIDNVVVSLFHQQIESLCRPTFEETVGGTLFPYTVHHITPLLKLAHHVDDGVLIIL